MAEPATPASTNRLRSGENDGLVLAVDPHSGEITGHYHAYVGFDDPAEGLAFHCRFLFHGRAVGAHPFTISTWFPDRGETGSITGTIAPAASPGVVEIHLAEEHGGCWNVQHFADERPARFELTPADWREIRIVAAATTHFHAQPRSDARLATHVIAGDVVRVFANRDGWVDALYIANDGRPTRGWLSERDLLPSAPPKAPSP